MNTKLGSNFTQRPLPVLNVIKINVLDGQTAAWTGGHAHSFKGKSERLIKALLTHSRGSVSPPPPASAPVTGCSSGRIAFTANVSCFCTYKGTEFELSRNVKQQGLTLQNTVVTVSVICFNIIK
jgi:hypothetical protein